jgi:amino acid adenylation domain-containing protein/non-ribosomal peptide synthase protein (TIGR01720 family)/FkbM family methyltransferase
MQADVVEGFLLSPQQERLWLQGNGPNPVYRAQCAFSIEGALDVEALIQALADTVGRHEILRTNFQFLPGMSVPLQIISDEAKSMIRHHDLSDLGPQERQDRFEAIFAEAGAAACDLPHGSLLDTALVTVAAGSYILLVNLPSLCADRISLDLLLGEIVRGYEAIVGNVGNVEEPGPPVQYAAASQWLNDLLDSPHSEAGIDFWRDQKALDLPAARLPFSKEPSPQPAFSPVFRAGPSAGQLSARIKTLADQYGTSPAPFILTCWLTLIWRLTGQSDIVIGIAFDGRTDADLEDALGLFARYLPLKTHFERGLRFSELLQRVDSAVAEFEEWQEWFSWDRVAKSTAEATGQRFFDFCFEAANQPSGYSAAGVSFSVLKRYVCIDRFGLKLGLEWQGDSIATEVHYDSEQYDAECARQLADYLETLLAGAVQEPEAPIDRLAILGDAERRELLVEFNRTAADYTNRVCLHELFEEQVRAISDGSAVVSGDEIVTYTELDRRANQLANFLRGMGAGPETRVAICLERSIDMVVGILGSLKAGAAYVPLDPEYPRERLAFILNDVGNPLLLTQQKLAGGLPMQGTSLVCLDEMRTAIAGQSAKKPVSGVTFKNLAYVIYTSGSTGTPKGVMIQHQGICNHMLWMKNALGLTQSDVIVQKTSFSFDASISEFFAALASGALLVMSQPGGHRDSGYLVRLMIEEQVTILQLVPSLLRVLAREPGLQNCESLRSVICAGEALPYELHETCCSLLPGDLFNFYGPTETCIDATWWPCREEVQGKTVPIGRPISNLRAYVLDSHLEPTPARVIGEVYLGGDGVVRGYAGQAERTAERFIPDRFSHEPGARSYRTGDLGRHLREGAIEFGGRADDQVKIRGFRIEPGEIESVLRLHPGVREAVVAAHQSEGGEKRLVAYVVPERFYRLPNALSVVHLNQSETDLIYREIFEDRSYLKHGIALADGDCVFDVGANIGMFTLFVHQECRNPRVYSFEPVPTTFRVLSANVARYGLAVELFNCGLSDQARTAAVTFYPGMSSMSGFYADCREDQGVSDAFVHNLGGPLAHHGAELLEGRFRSERFQCRLRTVSEVIKEKNIDRIDLLKIDVEKSELDVLNGIAPEDWDKIKQIVIEVHNTAGRLSRVAELLKERGFDFAVDQDASFLNTDLYNVYAVRPGAARRTAGVEQRPWSERTLPPPAADLAIADVRRFIAERLPEHMIPVAFVKMDAIGLLQNGKIDRSALPAPDWQRPLTEHHFVAPRNRTEATLCDIWAHTLGVQQVGVNDNFFELGGDSILAIQLVARANEAGLRLTLRQVFEHKTIASLSQVAGTARVVSAEQGVVTGAAPLTPAQRRFFELDLPEPHHFNQSILLEVSTGADSSVFAKTVQRLLLHHDALRLRFRAGDDGWQQVLASPEDSAPFARIDLSGFTAEGQERALSAAAARLQASLNLSEGPLIRVSLLCLGPEKPDLLLIVIHHLVVDGVSWRILIEDFEAAYRQLVRAQAPQLADKTTSFKQYAEFFAEFANSAELLAELDYWVSRPWTRVLPLPVEDGEGENPVASARKASVSLSIEDTAALVREVPSAYSTEINDVLLTALVQAFAGWTGTRELLVDLEGHGREPLADNLNLSRTVGWFTTQFPVLLELPEIDEPGEALKSIKEQLRGIPNRGIGFGLLRYMNRDARVTDTLSRLPRAGLSFNYLGQFDQDISSSALFRVVEDPNGFTRSPRGSRSHLIEINCGISAGRLRIEWTYSRNLHSRSTIDRLARDFVEAIRTVIAHCTSVATRGYTPSDFPDAELSQRELDELMTELGRSIGVG